MKTKIKQLGAGIMAVMALACTQQEDYKVERDGVLKFHDAVMADQGKVVDNQMKLDSMRKDLSSLKSKFPQIDTLNEKDTMELIRARLGKADENMNAWMHQFEPDVTGQSNEAAVKYFKAEKVKIVRIDSLYKIEIKKSDAYLNKFKK